MSVRVPSSAAARCHLLSAVLPTPPPTPLPTPLLPLLFSLLLLIVAPGARAIPTWEKTFTGDNNEEAYDVLHVQGGCAIMGTTTSYGPGIPDAANIFLYRLDGDGNLVWSRIYGNESGEAGYALTATPRRGFAICGGRLAGPTDNQILVIRTDEAGNEIWSRTYGTPWWDDGGCITATRDGQLVIGGIIGKGDYPVAGDAYALWLDMNGEVIRSQTYGGPLGDFFQEIALTADGGFLFGGSTNRGDHFDIFLARTDAAGNPLWTQMFGEADHDRCGGVHEAPDGSIYVTGTSTDAALHTDAFLAKLDAGGQILWVHRYNGMGSDGANDLVATYDGGFLLAGSTEPAPGRADVWLVRTDADGEVLWTRTHTIAPPSYADLAWAAARSGDGGFFVAGVTSGTGPGTEIYVIKTDEDGRTGEGDGGDLPAVRRQIPARTILLEGNGSRVAQRLGSDGEEILVFDASGRLCARSPADRIGHGLPAGVYFLRPEGSPETVRLVKTR